MELARVSGLQVAVTRCGLDKTPFLLALQSMGYSFPPVSGESARKGAGWGGAENSEAEGF